MNNATYYEQLAQGARYLASRETDAAGRQVHLSWANRYQRLALDAKTPAPHIQIPVAA